jgi:hypothetical protein
MVAIDRRGDDPSKLDFFQNKKITPLPADIKKTKAWDTKEFQRGYVDYAKTHFRR